MSKRKRGLADDDYDSGGVESHYLVDCTGETSFPSGTTGRMVCQEATALGWKPGENPSVKYKHSLIHVTKVKTWTLVFFITGVARSKSTTG